MVYYDNKDIVKFTKKPKMTIRKIVTFGFYNQ